MASNTSHPSQLDLANWCRGEGVDAQHALLIYGVLENVDIVDIEETAETIKALGKVRVRGKMFHPQHQSLMVLCECREVVDPTKIRPEVTPIMGGSAWNTVHLSRHQEKLSKFLQNEGKTAEDIQRLCTPNIAWNNNPESIIRAVGDVWGRASKPIFSNFYRHLRIFSGVSPTPTGEESLDSCLEQAKFLVDECECSEKEKRRRIFESLKSPA